jgi:hypothetical protein
MTNQKVTTLSLDATTQERLRLLSEKLPLNRSAIVRLALVELAMRHGIEVTESEPDFSEYLTADQAIQYLAAKGFSINAQTLRVYGRQGKVQRIERDGRSFVYTTEALDALVTKKEKV